MERSLSPERHQHRSPRRAGSQTHLGIRQYPFESIIADEPNTSFDRVAHDERGAAGVKSGDSFGFQRRSEDRCWTFSLHEKMVILSLRLTVSHDILALPQN